MPMSAYHPWVPHSPAQVNGLIPRCLFWWAIACASLWKVRSQSLHFQIPFGILYTSSWNSAVVSDIISCWLSMIVDIWLSMPTGSCIGLPMLIVSLALLERAGSISSMSGSQSPRSGRARPKKIGETSILWFRCESGLFGRNLICIVSGEPNKIILGWLTRRQCGLAHFGIQKD